VTKCVLWLLLCLSAPLYGQQQSGGKPTVPASPSGFTLKTSVDRVLVDVTVTDARGRPVHGLTKADFSVEEDGKPQTLLSFDAYDFDRGMTYIPPKLPALPPDTFFDLPASPERGPLYVLLYDLVNIPQGDQAFARAQLVKFLKNAPAGARYAIFVSTDGLYQVQGFTSDKQ
jgi:VWFA-related protein